ncbi:MAG: hypothetical protein HYY06_32325 [Deltaproteobacteria bacterium]|nr:hypothetical protein [Deltaproteobacteria bacterium]
MFVARCAVVALFAGCGGAAAPARAPERPPLTAIPRPPSPTAAGPALPARPAPPTCGEGESIGSDGECWSAPRTIRELDAQGQGCSWTTSALSGRVQAYDLDVNRVAATVRLGRDGAVARFESPLGFDARLDRVGLRTVRPVELAGGAVALGPGAALLDPREGGAGVVRADVVIGNGALVRSLSIPCDAVAPGNVPGDDEGDPAPIRGRAIAFPPAEIPIHAEPGGEPVGTMVMFSRPPRVALRVRRGAWSSIERQWLRGHRIRAWVRGRDIEPPRASGRSRRGLPPGTRTRGGVGLSPAGDTQAQGGLIGLLPPEGQGRGGLIGMRWPPDSGTHGDGLGIWAPLAAPVDPCLFLPGTQGERVRLRVARGTPVAESRVGRALVWAQVATDEPLDLLVPAEGDRARIVSVPGLTPVRQDRLCPNVFLDAWIPKGSIHRP